MDENQRREAALYVAGWLDKNERRVFRHRHFSAGTHVWRGNWRHNSFSYRPVYKSEADEMGATGIAMTITVFIGMIVGTWGIYLTRKPG